MAQWKRAGPITQRSEDQNLALLVVLLLLKRMFEDFFKFTYFSPIKLKQNHATGDKRGRMRATEISIGYIWPYQRVQGSKPRSAIKFLFLQFYGIDVELVLFTQ